MEKIYKKIESFTDLNVWREGHRFVLAVYAATQRFPKEEMFGLTSQLRRAVVSFTSNIAEDLAGVPIVTNFIFTLWQSVHLQNLKINFSSRVISAIYLAKNLIK